MAIEFDPLSPAGPSYKHHTFKTLERERLNRHPSENGMDHPALEEIVKPHIASFDALTDLSGEGSGLLQAGIQNILPKVVFDGKKSDGSPFGNKITCEPRTCMN
jgi:DNA-directed RNA polymerase I subunit RPA2